MGGKKLDEQEVLTRDERVRMLARELGQLSPALARLTHAVKQNPELSAFMEARPRQASADLSDVAGEAPGRREERQR